MKSWIRQSLLRRYFFILAGAAPLAAWSQGPLLPAGVPAPTMKTLDQVEPRIPISSLPFSISLPGSYYLTANLTGTAGANGIEGDGCTVKDCVVTENEGVGIVVGTASIVSGCRLIENELGGIQVGERSVIQGNACSENFDFGIQATGVDNRIVDNHVTTHTIGLDLDASDNYVAGNTVVDNGKNYDCVPGNQLNLLLWEIPESIDWPASVRLAGTLTGRTGQDGITINAGDVTIGLNGHSLVGVPGSLSGIHIPTAIENIEIRNGTIRAWGHYGINAVLADNCHFLNLRAVANGFGTPFSYGLQAGPRSMIRGCTASGNASFGIAGGTASIIDGCVSTTNGVSGIRAFNCTVTDCSASDNLGPGIHADASSVTDCTAQGNAGGGIRVSDNSTLKGTRCVANGGSFGIRTTSSGNRIENNHVLDQAIGLDVEAGGNYVADNIVRGNADNCVLLNLKAYTNGWGAAGSRNGLFAGNNSRIEGCLSDGNRGGGIFVWQNSTVDQCSSRNNGSTGIIASTNSVVRGWAAENNGNAGILLSRGGVLADCSATKNEVRGIWKRDACLVRDCSATDNEDSGIVTGDSCTVRSCTSKGNLWHGFLLSPGGTISGCTGSENGANGIDAFRDCTVQQCVAANNGDDGISVFTHSFLENNRAYKNGRDGISVGSSCLVKGNTCTANGSAVVDGAGIKVPFGNCRIEGNTFTDNDVGLRVASSGNLILRNSAADNNLNYDIVSLNKVGVIVSAPNSPAISGNTGGAGAGTTDPWANFSF